MPFSSLTVSQFLDALASAEPTPGGGTAAAIAGAMGTSLLTMVAGLPRTRGNTDEERARLADVGAQLRPLRAELEVCADRDTEAFNQVMAAYRLPKATDDDKAARKVAIAAAMRGATEAPLETLRVAAAALALGVTVAKLGNPSAASDAGVAAGLLVAAAEGAVANVRINLESLSDAMFRAEASARMDAHANAARTSAAAMQAALAV
jgi:formiminotetrahydrofolate cyclodeaminase